MPAARKAAFQYDFMDRLTATTYGDGSPGVTRTYWPDGKEKSNTTAQWTWTMDYNNRRLLTRETYAYPVVAPGETYPIGRIYNAYGDQQRMDYWGGISVDYAPNALGQPTRASGFAEAVTWHPNGALAGYTRPGTNPARTFSMQLNARQLPQAWFETGVMNDTFTYDQSGNVTGITDNYSGLNTRSMGFDALDRLTTANGVWGGGSYGYDGLDNLRTSTVGTRSLTHQFDPGTQRLTGLAGSQNVSFGYDVQGNITSRSTGSASLAFVFDIGNRMTRAENVPGVGTVQYTYDGNGRRAWAAYPGGTHRGFAYGLDGKLLIVGDTVNERIADWYIHLGDRQIGQVNLRAGAEFVHTDYLGSVVARSTVGGVLEATRTRYEPFGRVSSGFEPVGGGYTGHVHDSDTALINMQQRYYEPLAGRFLSVDPVVTDADTGRSFNRYGHARNNPYKYTDPDGRDPWYKEAQPPSPAPTPTPVPTITIVGQRAPAPASQAAGAPAASPASADSQEAIASFVERLVDDRCGRTVNCLTAPLAGRGAKPIADITKKISQFERKSLRDQKSVYKNLQETYEKHLDKYAQKPETALGETNRMQRELSEMRRILEGRGVEF